ncbi:MAG: glycoside hydrolase family 88 protein [Anaerolineae bacterium]|nr:glycoside hydrolase family 88 protein [Anaerolineae bacterium]
MKLTAPSPTLAPRLQRAFDFAQQQVYTLTQNYPDFFPMYTIQGRWKHAGETWTNWCEGFLGGMMWIFYARTGATTWRTQAEHYSRLIAPRQVDRDVHDLGFLFWSTYKRWYDLTGDAAANRTVITAGQTLGLRFKEQGQYLCSFVGAASLFIDIMMNVGIVFYAAQQTGDDDLLRKAHAHCRTTRRTLVRGDGSTAHEGIFDLETGEFLRQTTHQGWRGDSAWARGLAWALYGFGAAYQMTGESTYLETACHCADFYLRHTPDDGVPPNDYDDPRRPVLLDSSAAAIAACGLLDLSVVVALVGDALRAQVYRQMAFTILQTLTGPAYLASETPGWEGILKHGVYHRLRGLGVDESVMWGDYFFVVALNRALKLLAEVNA